MDEYRVEIQYAHTVNWGPVEGRTFPTQQQAQARIAYWQDYYIKPRQFRVTTRTLTPWEPI